LSLICLFDYKSSIAGKVKYPVLKQLQINLSIIMKTILKKYLIFLPAVIVMVFLSCHSKPKDSSAVADSANQKQIVKTDSANKAQQATSDSTLNAKKGLQEDASKFLVKSYESGMYEIQLSQLAATNAVDQDVKNLAAMLVTDHTAINAKISAIAASANFVLPSAVNADHQKDLQDMGKLTGADFDKKYINTIVSGHEKSVSSYKDAYKNLSAGDTQTFAGETLPKIQDHLAMAKKVQDRIK
jgi:putative membrane protein